MTVASTQRRLCYLLFAVLTDQPDWWVRNVPARAGSVPACTRHTPTGPCQESVGLTLYRAAIAFAVSESGPGGATKIASR